jgi:hypothetical protein
MIVEGNATITGTVLGYYGEPGGRLLVKGDLNAGHLLNGFMYQIKVAGEANGILYSFDTIDCIDGFNAQQIKSSFAGENELVEYPLEAMVVPYDTDLKNTVSILKKLVHGCGKGRRFLCDKSSGPVSF